MHEGIFSHFFWSLDLLVLLHQGKRTKGVGQTKVGK
jgi:hypothetical protein